MALMIPVIIFFVPEWPALTNAILHSQVLSVASFLKRSGIDCRFLGAEISKERAREAVETIVERYGIEAEVHPWLSHNARSVDLWRSCYLSYRSLRNNSSKYLATHIYTRSFIAARWAQKLARERSLVSVFDVRGLVSDEQFLRDRNMLKRWVIGLIEVRSIRRADRLATVSHALKEHIRQTTGRQDTIVIPSCFDDNRFRFDQNARTEIRRGIGIKDNEIVLCYSGGMDRWQRIDDIVNLMKEICTIEPSCWALMITREKKAMECKLAERGFPTGKGIVHCCRHDDMAGFLSAADIGIIMRNDIAVNRVASPIKIAEYLSCRLPVVLTSGIGDYSEALPAAGVGLFLNESKPLAAQVLDFIRSDNLRAIRTAAQSFAINNLTMAANLDSYRKLYSIEQKDTDYA